MFRNCKKCGVLFDSVNESRLCSECTKQDDEVFMTVKSFIYENPGATISEVASSLEISVTRIKRYLREGRLEIIEKHNLFLECEKCGVAIQTGRFCTACTTEFFNELKNSDNPQIRQKVDKEADGIRFLFRDTVSKG